MPEVLEVAQATVYPWWILWFTFLPVVVGLLLAIIDEEAAWFVFGVLVGFISALIMGVIGSSVEADYDNAQHAKALVETGFQEVEFDGGDRFDAVWGGERVKGVLVLSGKSGGVSTYQILIVPPTSE